MNRAEQTPHGPDGFRFDPHGGGGGLFGTWLARTAFRWRGRGVEMDLIVRRPHYALPLLTLCCPVVLQLGGPRHAHMAADSSRIASEDRAGGYRSEIVRMSDPLGERDA